MRLAIVGPDSVGEGITATINAMWGGGVAILLGILLIRNVGRYPGVEKAASIIPGFSVSFGILVVVLLMLRLDYSRWVLAGSYISAIVIFYIGYSGVFGRKRLKVGVLALEDHLDEPLDVAGVEWLTLCDPDHDVLGLEAVAVDLRRDLPIEWERRIADFALAGVPVYQRKHLIESLTGRVELEHLSETSFGTLSPPSAYMVPKHIVDFVTSVLALVLLAPLLVIVAVLIRIDSPGPSIFSQQRVGFRGQPFTVYKFRTMRNRHEADKGGLDAAITRENDDRITRLGRFLRRTRIDELPQIINIVKREMSWIGPRPEAAVLSSWYESEIPFYRYRHIVRPGITGWAQVMQGHVADVEQVRSKLYYDFYYIKNYSLWIDILIVVRTIKTMFSGNGAK
ncbi:polyprenyl glycosylphosphotransferase [Sphingomonas sp. ID1715]|uniref:sugar transferase n=1 Tax=Sphingomonas sp. ID1715 TaxID=1656898 RepID=UPI0017FF3E84|nr:polyprenyl glycosylphosphotransferase [Sphingomonas sp. ID1715]